MFREETVRPLAPRRAPQVVEGVLDLREPLAPGLPHGRGEDSRRVGPGEEAVGRLQVVVAHVPRHAEDGIVVGKAAPRVRLDLEGKGIRQILLVVIERGRLGSRPLSLGGQHLEKPLHRGLLQVEEDVYEVRTVALVEDGEELLRRARLEEVDPFQSRQVEEHLGVPGRLPRPGSALCPRLHAAGLLLCHGLVSRGSSWAAGSPLHPQRARGGLPRAAPGPTEGSFLHSGSKHNSCRKSIEIPGKTWKVRVKFRESPGHCGSEAQDAANFYPGGRFQHDTGPRRGRPSRRLRGLRRRQRGLVAATGRRRPVRGRDERKRRAPPHVAGGSRGETQRRGRAPPRASPGWNVLCSTTTTGGSSPPSRAARRSRIVRRFAPDLVLTHRPF